MNDTPHKHRCRQYYKNNTEYVKSLSRKYREANPCWRLWAAAKTRSKNKKIEFNITVDDIYIPMICPILKLPLTNVLGIKKQDFNPSLDRIDPSKGYVKGNIQVISNLANVMKNSASENILKRFAAYYMGVS